MNKQREALKLALEAIKNPLGFGAVRLEAICEEIREALAEPEPEPVAWMCPHDPERETAFSWRSSMCESSDCGHQRVPLYTSPPARKPLTDNTLWEMWVESPSDVMRFARSIERAHGICDAVT